MNHRCEGAGKEHVASRSSGVSSPVTVCAEAKVEHTTAKVMTPRLTLTGDVYVWGVGMARGGETVV